MPQLISHRDGFGWQTPNIADILVSPRRDEGHTQQLRGLATVIVRKLAELGTPVRLKDMDRYTSHTRYHLVPDKIGGKGSERDVTLADLQGVLPQLLPHLGEVQAAELVTLHPDEPTISLFLRNSLHNPLSLREMLEQKSFLDAPSYTSLGVGMDIAHKAIVKDWNQLRHLVIIGQTAARHHLQFGLAATLMLFNSPSYMRLALVGEPPANYQSILTSPHVLGNVAKTGSTFRKLLDGLLKHIGQRRAILAKQNTKNIDDFNKQALSDKNLKPLPHLVILVDTQSVQGWQSTHDQWVIPFHQLLNKGGEVGLHVLLTVPNFNADNIPERLHSELPHRAVLRSALNSVEALAPHINHIPLNFVDGVWWSEGSVIPVEMAALNETELTRLSTYWQNMKHRRDTELQTKGEPLTSGNTGLLTLRADMLPTAMLKAMPDMPDLDSTQPAPPPDAPVITDQMVASAQALAAYLGWLGVGPLQDVLALSHAEAQETLHILRMLGFLEDGTGPTWRFVRLANLPATQES